MSSPVAHDLTASATPPESRLPVRRDWRRFAPALVIVLAPLFGILALRAPLVNSLMYRDPWFYSGYAWSLSHNVEVFGWFYYAVRFSGTLPIAWTTDLFGAEAGFIVLRLAILMLTGWAVYACVRRFASVSVACAAVVLLSLNSFYLRLVLWDYTSFVALPGTIAGAAIWFLGRTNRTRWATAAASGALFCAAAFGNPQAVLVAPALYGVEAVAALRLGVREVRHLAARLVASGLGALAMLLAGYLGYALYLGFADFTPRDLIQPTLDFSKSFNKNAAPFQIPARVWLEHEPRVYAPLLAGLATIIVMGRRLVDTSLIARVAQFALAYTAIIWVYRKVLKVSVIETWWAYNMTAVTIVFALPVVLHVLRSRSTGSTVRLLSAGIAGTAVASLAVRSFPTPALGFYDAIRQHLPLLVLLLVAVALLALAMRLPREYVRNAAVALFTAGVAVVALTPADYIGVRIPGEFSRFHGTTELASYGAAHDMTMILDRDDEPDARVFMWSSMGGMANMAWTGMPHQQGGIGDSENPKPITALTPIEVDQLRYPTTRGVLVFDEDAEAVARATTVLNRYGFRTVVRSRGTWGDGQLSFARIDLVGKP